jgi:hypothetical protein
MVLSWARAASVAADIAARFAAFLSNPAPRFEVRLTRFAGERWEISNDSRTFVWPAANFV